MSTESIISATFGSPGSGKTYSRVKFLVDDFLINNPTGIYITNIPLNCDVIADYVSRKLSKGDTVVTPDDILSRLHVIPDDVMVSWEKLNHLENRDLNSFDSFSFPPTVYFQSFDLSCAHIAIDEFHKYFSKKGPKVLKKLWNDWFAEIRKTGCTFEGITQSYGQLSEEFLDKCSTRVELINHSDTKDPFLKIRMGDWYELRAGLLGKLPLQRVSVITTRRSASNSGRLSWKPVDDGFSFVLSGEYFIFYDSFHNSTGSSGERKSPAEIYGRRVVFWFLRRNFSSIFSKILLFCLFIWFTIFGGWKVVVMPVFRSIGMKVSQNELSDRNSGFSNVKPSFSSSDFDPYIPVYFDSSFCILKSGLVVTVGYVFSGGPYDSKSVSSIDFSARCYVLNDGTRVFMR